MNPTKFTNPETVDFSDWVENTETLSDVASSSASVKLAAILNHPRSLEEAHSNALFPLGHWLQFTPSSVQDELGADGHPKLGGFMPPLPLPRRMWAGSSIDFHRPICVGQQLSRITTIESITPKNGSSGALCFVVLRHDVAADQTLALTERQTIVYREAVPVAANPQATSRPPREDTPAPEGWDWVETKRPDTITLFRYSALTFNSHRIHYDLPYATEVEGYPGLVVHGPLMATYIMDSFVKHHPEAVITSFTFQARSPIFVGEQLHVVGRVEDTSSDASSEQLSVVAPGGGVAVTAHITFR
ncbi:3-methylfumaryl-CoA hydratase [Leucobacter exalbidus]|uniref:3-methylfumaryl-CoA hydratase n=1 Tax=Leucobacter exalbidus TaxID=662960 RepID=A0A940T4Y4_9MICO|nr:3-methylfumaryl-CoA hydratase [Leucobacter exalbidus]